MTPRLRARIAPASALAAALAFLPALLADGPDADTPPQEPKDTHVLPRGPVHEAFAQPGRPDPGPAPLVSKKLPDPIAEDVPDTKPDDEEAIWIPGYWAWDDDGDDFLWVGGVWRVPPPGRSWMPGAWHQAEGGYQWSPGFWADEGQKDAPLLPESPAPEEDGPPGPPPDANSFWAAGSWVMGPQGYEWQGGTWTAFRPGWVWQPARYVATPAGYVYVDGYWDLPLENRGVVYAPVSFSNQVWLSRGWRYRPAYTLSQAALADALFVGPGGRRFVFGDYYGSARERAGYRPWFGAAAAASLYSYYRWHYRAEPGWAAGLERAFRGRHEGHLPRPAATLAAQHRLLADRRHDAAARAALHMVGPASRLAHQVRVSAEHRRAHAERARHFHEAARARAAARPAARAGAHAALRLAHSPAAHHAVHKAAKAVARHVPPPKPSHPKPKTMKPTKMHGGGKKKH